MKVAIMMPAYDEEECIGKTITEIRDVMKDSGYEYVILVQDDHSNDNTYGISKGLADGVTRNPHHLGLVGTFKEELKNPALLDVDLIVHTDADGQYLPEYIIPLIKKMGEGQDLVVGSRFLNGMEYSGPIVRRWGNVVLSKFIGFIFGIDCTDVTSGFRAFNGTAVGRIHLTSTHTYTYEQYIKAAESGLRVAEVAIKTRKTRPSRLIHNTLEYAFYSFMNVMMIYYESRLCGKR